MLKRVTELKENREKERKIFVEKMMEKRFREGADELRKVGSELDELKANFERDL